MLVFAEELGYFLLLMVEMTAMAMPATTSGIAGPANCIIWSMGVPFVRCGCDAYLLYVLCCTNVCKGAKLYLIVRMIPAIWLSLAVYSKAMCT